jgi:ketosteroid isomerase-like protein
MRFVDVTFGRLARVLPDGVILTVRHVHIAGDTTIAELHLTSTTTAGDVFSNDSCGVCRFDGDTIVDVRAYLDSMVAYPVLRNERHNASACGASE